MFGYLWPSLLYLCSSWRHITCISIQQAKLSCYLCAFWLLRFSVQVSSLIKKLCRYIPALQSWRSIKNSCIWLTYKNSNSILILRHFTTYLLASHKHRMVATFYLDLNSHPASIIHKNSFNYILRIYIEVLSVFNSMQVMHTSLRPINMVLGKISYVFETWF